MHPRLEFIRGRIAADFPDLPQHGLVGIRIVDDPDFGVSLAFGEHIHGSIDDPDIEDRVARAADYFQDVVIDNLMSTWPEVGGRPLFPSADSGVACWCLEGKPWCAVGQLAAALAAAEGVDRAGTCG